MQRLTSHFIRAATQPDQYVLRRDLEWYRMIAELDASYWGVMWLWFLFVELDFERRDQERIERRISHFRDEHWRRVEVRRRRARALSKGPGCRPVRQLRAPGL